MHLAVPYQARKGESVAIRGELAAAACLNASESLRGGRHQPKRKRKSECQFERKFRFDWTDEEPLLKIRICWSWVLHKYCSEALSIMGILIRLNQTKAIVCMKWLQDTRIYVEGRVCRIHGRKDVARLQPNREHCLSKKSTTQLYHLGCLHGGKCMS